jgi:hypothetical protein
MINLQLIVSGTLANAGRPERVTNKTKQLEKEVFQFFLARLEKLVL